MKKILIITVLITFSLMSFGQFYPLENYPTPNAASLGEFGNIPVNMFSGTPIISIPLYEVREGNISVPISLNYNLASVKPNVHPGWVGLGWHLSAGGAITRAVRGTYDEHRSRKIVGSSSIRGQYFGFYSNHTRLQSVFNATSLGLHERAFLTRYVESNPPRDFYELMTDEYNFNFGQYSGSFYLDEFGNWVVVSDHDIQVEFDPKTGFRDVSNWNNYPTRLRPWIYVDNWGSLDGHSGRNSNTRFFNIFTLITPDGKRYTFGGDNAVEYSIGYYTRQQSSLIPTTWFLTKIESPEGHKITLEYEPGRPIAEIGLADHYLKGEVRVGKNSCWLSVDDDVDPITPDNDYQRLVGYLMFPVYLKQIKTTHTTVDFHASPVPVQEMLLPEKFISWNHFYDEIISRRCPFTGFASGVSTFNHLRAFTSGGDPLEQNLEWLMLNSITVSGSLDKAFSLDYYYPISTPNGVKSRRKLRHITEQAGDNNRAYRFEYNTNRIFPRYLYANVDHWGFYRGGERTANESPLLNQDFYESRNATVCIDVAQAETLREIIYPTGGRTVFTYEQNTWSKIVPADKTQDLIIESGRGGGLRVSEIRHYDVDDRLLQSQKYLYTDSINSNLSSGILKGKKIYEVRYDFNHRIYQYYDGRLITSYDVTGFSEIGSESGFMARGTNQRDPIVGYSSVIVQTIDGQGTPIGYVRYRHTNHHSHRDENYEYAFNYRGIHYGTPVTSRSMERGKIVSEDYFDANNKLVKSIQYKYTQVNSGRIKAPWQQRLPFVCSVVGSGSDVYIAFMNYIYTHRYFVSEIIETDFDPNTGNSLTSTTKRFTYNNSRLLTSKEITNSDSKVHRTKYIYPFEIQSGPQREILREMTNRNIISDYVHRISFVDGRVVEAETRIFGNVGTATAPIFKPVEIRMLRPNNPIPESQLYTWQGTAGTLGFSGCPTQHNNSTNSDSREFTLDFSGQLNISRILFEEMHIGDFHMSSTTFGLQVIRNGSAVYNKSIFMITEAVGNGYGTMYRFENNNNISIDLTPGRYTILLTRNAPLFFEGDPPIYRAEVHFSTGARTTDLSPHLPFRPEIAYQYDNKGNVIEVKLIQSNTVTTYLWSYAQQYPIAQIEGLSYEQVSGILGDNFIGAVAKAIQPTAGNMQEIRSKIASARPDAFVTTFTHIPLVGISSITDPRGITTYYNYDAFGRLREVYLRENGQKQILQAYDYQYRN